MIRVLLSLVLVLFTAGCGMNDPTFVRLGDYECDAGEAVIRHLVDHLPDVTKGVPNEFCIVKALDLRSVDMDYTRRFANTGKTFISRDILQEQQELHYPINPKSGLSPTLLHLRHLKKLDAQTYEIEAGWAYKNTFEMKRFRVTQTGGTWKAEEQARIDGNYDAPAPAPAAK